MLTLNRDSLYAFFNDLNLLPKCLDLMTGREKHQKIPLVVEIKEIEAFVGPAEFHFKVKINGDCSL